LTTQLADSFSEKKLGESILLSAKSLQGVRSRALNPGLLQEVIGGMRAVGLTKEARILAGEAVMGLSK
jgi:hypothetical protein